MSTRKPLRSPLLGYNHNISHLGRVFHVQTEDSGPQSPRLFTHMFYEGTILASVKHEYAVTVADADVRVLMQNQHKTMIRDLLQAKFDAKLVAFFRARGDDVFVASAATAAAALASAPTPSPAPAVLAAPGAAGLPGALPSTPMAETPPPVLAPWVGLALADDGNSEVAAEGANGGAGDAALGEGDSEGDGGSPVPVAIPAAERQTRPLVSMSRNAGAATTSAGRVSEPRRSPFIRNVGGGAGASATKVTKVASMDSVVVQRTVRVGGSAPPPTITTTSPAAGIAAAAATAPPPVSIASPGSAKTTARQSREAPGGEASAAPGSEESSA